MRTLLICTVLIRMKGEWVMFPFLLWLRGSSELQSVVLFQGAFKNSRKPFMYSFCLASVLLPWLSYNLNFVTYLIFHPTIIYTFRYNALEQTLNKIQVKHTEATGKQFFTNKIGIFWKVGIILPSPRASVPGLGARWVHHTDVNLGLLELERAWRILSLCFLKNGHGPLVVHKMVSVGPGWTWFGLIVTYLCNVY